MRLIRGWPRVLVGLLLAVLVLVACSGATGESGVTPVPQGEPTPVVDLEGPDATLLPDQRVMPLTINVVMTDDGFQPSSIFIPVGREARLVVRNHGMTEHHYKVEGLVPGDVLWRAPAAASVTEEEDEHLAHHPGASYVPFRSTSRAGIKPTGDEVHAYAAAGGLDVILFTATNTGTFLVQDPLHPEIVGKVKVFASTTSQAQEFEEARLRALELSRTTLLPEYAGVYNIKLEVLYATPAYFAMAVDEEGVARYAPEEFYVFLVSETIHEGETLPESPPPATLRVDGHEIAPSDVKVLVGSSHHRTSVVRFTRSPSVDSNPEELELLIAGAGPVAWKQPGVSESLSPKSVRQPAPRVSWAVLLPGLAGVLAALGPCLTQLVVYYMATLTGVSMEVLQDERARAAQRRRVLRTALFFSLGFTIVYTAGGAMAGVIGQKLQSLGLLETWNRPLSMAAGVVMLLLGWRVAVNARAPLVCRLPLSSRLRSERGTGLLGSMMMGVAFAFGCLSCFGATVLTVLLLYAGASGSVLMGTLMMFIFSLGLTVPFLLAALGMGRILPLLTRLEHTTPWLGLAGGVVMMGFGLLMITYRFHRVSAYIYSLFFT